MSPSQSHMRTLGGINNVKRAQNVAAKAAAQRLAQVMASQKSFEDEEDEDLSYLHYNGSNSSSNSTNNFSTMKTARSSSPFSEQNFVNRNSDVRTISDGRRIIYAPSQPVVPPSRTTLKSPPMPPIELPTERKREPRLTANFGNNADNERSLSEASLRDEIDILLEENENILNKLRLAEERYEKAESRARELEKQVATLGVGVSLESRLLKRKEAALKASKQTKGSRDEEIMSLRSALESANGEAEQITGQLREVESETKALCVMIQRMVLTQEEMEEVVLKRCWLARYWGLAVRYGIYPEIAVVKHEHWSSLAPLPLEVVTSAGQKAKESLKNSDSDFDRKNLVPDMVNLTGEGNIENMLLVEKGLRELASLKVEDAVLVALSQNRRPNSTRTSASDLKWPADSNFLEAFELSPEEVEDVLFKKAWLAYFWRRAKSHGVERDIAEKRLIFWTDSKSQELSSHDAICVNRGLSELRNLRIEQQLWETSRREIKPICNSKPAANFGTSVS